MSEIEPFAKRAIVEPCVVARDGPDRVSLVAVVRGLLRSMEFGHIEIAGKPGGGKTTALRHLAHVFANRNDVEFVDLARDRFAKYESRSYCVYTRDDGLNVCNCDVSQLAGHLTVDDGVFASVYLAPWCIDDWIEYLLTVHPDACASVMARIRDDPDMSLLDGSPALCAMVLDMLAERPDVNDIPCVLVEYLDAHLPKGTLRDDAMKVALSRYLTPTDETIPDKPAERLQAAELSPTVRALLRTETAQLYLASSRVCDDLQKKRLPKYFRRHIKPELIRAVASAIEPDAKIRKRLLKAVAPGSPEENHAAVAGILNATSHGWRPTPGKLPNLEGAYLAGARWDRVSLVRGRCRRANLARAILRESDMESCDLGEAVLTRADLTGACLNNASCNGTSFNYAQLCHCRSETTNYFFADLVRADFTGANLKWATLVGTDCRDARFVRADLTRAHIFKANISGVDFTSASLRASEVSGMDFRATLLRGTSFARAKCVRCNFEDVDFPIADFYAADLVGALFTGANMPNAIFGEADLRETGLFEVNWPGADLRGADLRGASFHAGSSRSGLVGSPIASEGTRTGFYTDEYLDQSYRAPEEIRVANLRGADLRGADIFETDFYLVDLREAKYHGPQAEHLRKCGAILEARV